MITNIKCSSKHLIRSNKGWRLLAGTQETWSSYPIGNMMLSRKYFRGVMQVHMKQSRKFGKIVDSIVVTDENGVYRNVYKFDYSGAMEYETERGFSVLQEML